MPRVKYFFYFRCKKRLQKCYYIFFKLKLTLKIFPDYKFLVKLQKKKNFIFVTLVQFWSKSSFFAIIFGQKWQFFGYRMATENGYRPNIYQVQKSEVIWLSSFWVVEVDNLLANLQNNRILFSQLFSALKAPIEIWFSFKDRKF